MNKLTAAAILVVFVGVAYAQVFSGGSCPNVLVQSTFDLNRYLGDWYEVYKFYAAFESGQECARAHYELKSNGHIRIVNSGVNSSGKNISAVGDAYIPDPVNSPAKLKLKFSSLAPYGNYWVIDTDYDNYAFVYSCKSILGVTHYEFGWILSRHKNLTEAEHTKLWNEALGYGITTSNFKFNDQSQCPDLV